MSKESAQLLVGWFCPWAQRAWIVANLVKELGRGTCLEIVNDARSVVLDTDLLDAGADDSAKGDRIARYMVKGPLLGSMSVPALLGARESPIFGDSIALSAWLWEHFMQTTDLTALDVAFDTNEEHVVVSRQWSDAITKPFYDSIMNRNDSAQENFDNLVSKLLDFGDAIRAPYFSGNHLSIVDVSILPFVYRVLVIRLFHTFRDKELSVESLGKIDASVSSTGSLHYTGDEFPRKTSLIKLLSWYNCCSALGCFRGTLPADAQASSGYSQSLCNIYQIYALGTGLQSVNYIPGSA